MSMAHVVVAEEQCRRNSLDGQCRGQGAGSMEHSGCHGDEIQKGVDGMNEVDVPAVPIDNYPAKVTALEQELLKYEQVVMTPVHHFAAGLYARELLIPAGTFIVGQVHHFEHINFLMKGDITVFTDDGMKRMKAPAIITSRAGVKRAAVTHEDTIWVTVHATDEIEGGDIVALEKKLCSPTIADYDKHILEQVQQMLEGGSL